MRKIISVRFDNLRQVYCYDSNGLRIYKNNCVIARHEGNLDYGIVVNVMESKKSIDLPKIIRLASYSDKKKYEANKRFESYAIKVCKNTIRKYALKMKLINAKLNFDGTKIVFYFVSEKRVDFRELVRDLARLFKIKIEMKQLGVRDEAKNIPSMGICGRPLCCNKFIKQFDTVSIKMAKDQGISLSPMKISGNCGRLLCCLKYEENIYEELNKNIPPVNSIVKTPDGEAKVIITNVLLQSVKVIFIGETPADTMIKVYPLDKVTILNKT